MSRSAGRVVPHSASHDACRISLPFGCWTRRAAAGRPKGRRRGSRDSPGDDGSHTPTARRAGSSPVLVRRVGVPVAVLAPEISSASSPATTPRMRGERPVRARQVRTRVASCTVGATVWLGSSEGHRGAGSRALVMLSVGACPRGTRGLLPGRGAQDRRVLLGPWPGTGSMGRVRHLGLRSRRTRRTRTSSGALLAGHDPTTGEQLASTGRKIWAFDLTFSAPKSVSVLHAFAGLDGPARGRRRARGRGRRGAGLSRSARRCVPGAVMRARRVSTRPGWWRRRFGIGPAGPATRSSTPTCWRPTWCSASTAGGGPSTVAGCIAMLVLPGISTRPSCAPSWSSASACSGSSIWRGTSELDGIPLAVLREFSRRRSAIEDHLDQHQATSRGAAQHAALTTRLPKDLTVDLTDLPHRLAAACCGVGVRARAPRTGHASAAADGGIDGRRGGTRGRVDLGPIDLRSSRRAARPGRTSPVGSPCHRPRDGV